MNRPVKTISAWVLIFSACLPGCQPMQPYYLHGDGDLSHYLDVATEIEYTDAGQEPLEEVTHTLQPRTLSNPQFDEYWDLTLEDAVSITLNNSKVIRTFGPVRQFGQVLSNLPERLSLSPLSVVTVYDPAIQETSQSGVEQALANFDAIFRSTATLDRTDREQNFNRGVQSQARQFEQDRVVINNEISKLSASGTQFFFRNIDIYTKALNANTANVFAVPSDWFVSFETEFRQPLLRNRGTQVNRVPVILARIRTDQSLAAFRASVRDLLNNVEQAYWELYFFYHNLNAAKNGRDSALAAWQKVEALFEKGGDGGEAEKVAQAEEQYFFFRARMEEAQRDLFRSETRLRYLLGLSPTDGRLIRPADKPTAARVDFDWHAIFEESLARNVELIRQGWQIRQAEMQLIAARNQLLPQADIVGLYRWLGNGENFNSDRTSPGNMDFPPSAVGDLWSGDKQEYRVGWELNVPIGFRREMAQVRSSQLTLARERARLQDMELEVVHGLTDAVQRLDAGYRTLRTNFSRRVAANKQVNAVRAGYEAGTVPLDLLLDSERRQADANISYYQSLVEHNLNIANVHYRKGSLLDYNGVVLQEGPWPKKAYFDAVNEARRRDASYYLDYGFTRPRVISRGPAAKRWEGGAGLAETTEEMAEEAAGAPGGAYSDKLNQAIDSVTEEANQSLPAESLPPGDSEQPTPAGPTPATPQGEPTNPLPPPDFPADPDLPADLDLEAKRPQRKVARSRRLTP